MMLAHVELVNDGLHMRSCSLNSQDAFLLELLVRQTSVFHIPCCIFEDAIRLPHIDQLLTH